MAEIIRGYINIRGIKAGDALNVTRLTNYDLSGKHVAMDIKADLEAEPVLRFTTEDGSIEKEYDAENEGWLITFKKTSLEMKIRPGIYILDVEAYTSAEDTQTFADGQIEIEPEVTKRLK